MDGFKIIKKLNKRREMLAFFRPFGVIGVCLILVAASVITLIVFHSIVDHQSTLYSIVLAGTSGISASAIVTVFSEAIHNKERNLLRLNILNRYFQTISNYSFFYDSHVRAYKDLEEKYGCPNSNISVWNSAVEELSKHRKLYNVNGYTLSYVVNNMKRIMEIRDTCIKNSSLLRLEEAQEIHCIVSAIEQIEDEISVELTNEEATHSFIVEFVADLHESFDEYEEESCNDLDGLNRYRDVLKRCGVCNIEELCALAKDLDSIIKIGDIISEEFDGYDGVDISDEDTDNYPYPEIIYKEEFDKLKTTIYESEAVKHFKKSHLIKALTTDKNKAEAHEYLIDFLTFPHCLSTDRVNIIATFLIDIHQAMLNLEKSASKEPIYGAMIVSKKMYRARENKADQKSL